MLCSAVSYFSTRLGSIIGADRLSFRVRDGTGRFPVAMSAVTLFFCVGAGWWPAPGVTIVCVWWWGVGSLCFVVCGCGQHDNYFVCCVLVSFRPVSASSLHTLRCFQVWSIDPVVCGGPYPTEMGENPGLGVGFPLRCFQRLSCPNVAIQPCSWWNNWYTRGSSVPVLSY